MGPLRINHSAKKYAKFLRFGDSWYFRLVPFLQRNLWNENQFVNHVNLFLRVVHDHCSE